MLDCSLDGHWLGGIHVALRDSWGWSFHWLSIVGSSDILLTDLRLRLGIRIHGSFRDILRASESDIDLPNLLLEG